MEDGILDPGNYSENMEYDEYDINSIHFVAKNTQNDIVGTVRLVMNSELGFPIEKFCQFYPGTGIDERESLAEISRLAVPKDWRNPKITLGLWRCIYQESKMLGIEYWYAAMEKKLARLLRRFALPFKEIGPATNYNGERIPFTVSLEDVDLSTAIHQPDFYEFLRDGLEEKNESCSVPFPPHIRDHYQVDRKFLQNY